jgi:protein-S-isoprenylcysteine O-methyltransferase Ste14
MIQTKPWYQSRTIITNALLLVVFAIGLTVQAAGIYHLSPEIVAGLGIVAGVINFWLRLDTNSAITGTPAATAPPPPASG